MIHGFFFVRIETVSIHTESHGRNPLTLRRTNEFLIGQFRFDA